MNIYLKTLFTISIISLFGLLFCENQKNIQDNSSFIKIDSLLFIDSSPVPEYPYNDWYVAYQEKEQIEIDSAKALMAADSNLIIDYFPPKPEIFLIENNTDTISIKDYCKKYVDQSKQRSLLIFSGKMEWNGKISEIRLDKIKGKIPDNLDLIEMAKHLKGVPAKVDNIPLPGPNNFIFMINCGSK